MRPPKLAQGIVPAVVAVLAALCWLVPRPELLRACDAWLFEKINRDWTRPWLDAALPVLTDLHKQPAVWVLASAGLAAWLYVRRGRALKVILGLALVVGLTDMACHRLVKPYFRRARPEWSGVPVVLRTVSHSGHSFPSNHAANTFAGAAYLAIAQPGLGPPLYVVAGLVAYSRVYTGVHFPADVCAGAVLGLAVGALAGRLLGKMGLKA